MNLYEPYNEKTAPVLDRIAWGLCQIIDDDAPLRWIRFRSAARCISANDQLMNDLLKLAKINKK